ncbi:MAG TPA: YcxB family protein [Candidatus Faecivicinus avistercoris]|nr:YcxB family protein [Candidatus Faecivicinus avistercoris]
MKKPLFKATFRVTRESCLALARARSNQYFRTVWACNAMIALCVGLLWAVRSSNALWLTVVLALLVMHSLLGVRLTAARMYASRHASVDETQLDFCEEGIRVRSAVEESLIRYPLITGLREDRKHLVLYMRHHTPLVVVKDEINGGGAAALAAFLRERTGLEIRPLHR